MSIDIHHRSGPIVVMLALWAGCASPAAGAEASEGSGTLSTLSVGGSGGRVVVDLVSDQALQGVLEVVKGQPARLFVDLRNVISEVDPTTEVGRGAVQRVRVALNQAQPPVTRVVVDLSGAATYYLEQGKTERELRITVLADPTESSSATDQYAAWFSRTTETMAGLLTQKPQGQSDTEADDDQPEQLELGWNALRHELSTVQPPPPLEAAHGLLVTACALGHAATRSDRDDRLPDVDAGSALSGASLLLQQARSAADAYLAATDTSHSPSTAEP